MTEKQPELKPMRRAEAETMTDRTVVDAAHAREDQRPEPTPPDSEPEFSPGKFSRIEIPLELRKEMLQAKLPRLAPEFFQDTVPPNGALEAPPPASDDDLGPAHETTRRPPVALVVVCLIGAIFVLALAVFRSLLGGPEPAPATTTGTQPTAVPTHLAASVTSLPVAPTPPATSANPAELTPPTVESDQPPRATAPVRPKTPAISKSPHSPSTSAIHDAPAPPITPAPSTPSAVPTTPAPARTSWFHK